TGGDPLAALLPGIPGAIVALGFGLGRDPRRRRVPMAVSTTAAGFLALTTVASVGALGDPGPAVWFQIGCFVFSILFLAATFPAWKKVNALGDEADALLRMYDEL
ncbi:MAG: hypothetical protein AAGA20_19365, partial [Planctomycetota bacterium]